MNHLLALSMLGVFATTPIDTLPPKKKYNDKLPIYAICPDRRIIAWKRVADIKKNKRNPYFPTSTHLEPMYLN